MKPKEVYKKIMDNAKRLDSLYIKNKQLEDNLGKTEFLNTFLLGNSSNERAELQGEISKLRDEEFALSVKLREIGHAISGTNYMLVPYNENKLHVESALYTFLVQY